MSLGVTFQEHIKVGGLFEATPEQQAALSEQAQEAGLAVMVAECDRARSRSAVLRAVAKAVDYPEFFGNDLEALYDCLCETVLDQKGGLYLWFNKLHTGDDIIAQASKDVFEVCADVVDYASSKERVFVYSIIHAGKHSAPEPGVAPTPYLGRDES